MLTVEHSAPGEWLVLAVPGRLAAVHRPAPGGDLPGRVWSALGSDRGLGAVIDELTSTGLASTPAFVLAEWADAEAGDARFLVRGDRSIVIVTGDGVESLSARGVSTWLERPLEGVHGFHVALTPEASDPAAALPLVVGTAWASALHVGAVQRPSGAAAEVRPAVSAVLADERPAAAVASDAVALPEDVPDRARVDAAGEAAADRLPDLFDDAVAADAAPLDDAVPWPLPAEEAHGLAAGLRFALQLPDGALEPLDDALVVGRAPSVSASVGGRLPRLITVDSIEHDISRNHVQFAVEDGTVVVTDLHSRNGTLIAPPGEPPRKLRAGEPTAVTAGTIVDLGSGVTLSVTPI